MLPRAAKPRKKYVWATGYSYQPMMIIWKKTIFANTCPEKKSRNSAKGARKELQDQVIAD